MRNLPQPENYDFLWKVGNRTFLLTSVWLHQNWTRRDFFITYYNNEWKIYIGRKQRKRLSIRGLHFLKYELRSYEKDMLQAIDQMNNRFIREQRSSLKNYSHHELRARFLSLVHFGLKFWYRYFWTEYFCYDEVSRRIEQGNTAEREHLERAVARMGKLKFHFKHMLNQMIYGPAVLKRYFEEIQRRLRIKDISFYHYQELAKTLLGAKLKVKSRECFAWGKFNRWKVITGRKAEKIIKRFDEYIIRGVGNVFKGQVGNPGFYKGKVKIVPFDVKANYIKIVKSMKKGTMLVTGSTGPEMIIACKKAGAIITEEGGIISHAAIVSRELGIPCVIGTKIATKVLKDGDLVEVDADKGVVRIIE